MEKFRGLRVYQQDSKVSARIELTSVEELSAGNVVIKSAYSSVNYKDALAATGAGRIISKFPLIAGIDVAGTVVESDDMRFSIGDQVLVTGYEMGMSHDGGYAEYVRVPAEWVIPLPESISTKEAMIIGTAGFTAALCVHLMEQNGQAPGQGSILVSGASGGVGSMAIDMFSAKGYQVTALTGKMDEQAYLQSLGANEVLDRTGLKFPKKPMDKSLWAGAVDSVGGDILAWLTRTVQPWGNITSVGMAGGTQLETSVMPFILRGINLLGVTSAGCPDDLRHKVWQRIGTDLRPKHFDQIALTEVGLDDLDTVFRAMLNGETKGRTIVRL